MMAHLDINKGGCITDQVKDLLTILHGRGGFIAAKCGIYNEYLHVPLYFKDSKNEFIITILTRNNKYGLINQLALDIFNKIILNPPIQQALPAVTGGIIYTGENEFAAYINHYPEYSETLSC
jgi:hypothetical protein